MTDKFHLMSDSQKIRHLQYIIKKHEETIVALQVRNRQLQHKLNTCQNSLSSVENQSTSDFSDSDSQQILMILDKIINILNQPIYTHEQIKLIKNLLL